MFTADIFRRKLLKMQLKLVLCGKKYMKSKRTKKIIYFATVFIIFGVAGYIFLTLVMRAHFDMFTPDSSTTTTMYYMKRQILHYAKEHNKLPTSVAELPALEGFNNRNTDGWGHVINMQIKDTEVTLTSFGKDNKAGGFKANLDLVAIFNAKTETGAWADENEEGYQTWIQLPKIRWDKAEFE